MAQEIEQLLKAIKKVATSISYTMKRNNRQIVLLGPHTGLSVSWRYYYSSSLEIEKLYVTLWEGHPPFLGLIHWVQPEQRKSISFEFDLLHSESPGWRTKYPKQREFYSKELAKYILKFYMDDADPKR